MWKFSIVLTLFLHFSLCYVEGADEGCPEETDIAPCHCTLSSGNIIVDCSGVTSEDALQDVLSTNFPVTDMYRFDMVNNYYIPGFTKNVFGNLTFRSVKIAGSDITFINDVFFDNFHESLKVLTLSKSKLDNNGFSFDILPKFKSLTKLNLYNNYFTSLPPLLSTSLTVFNIHANTIREVDKNAFQTCKDVSYIGLDYNLIEDLDLYLFKGLFKLASLYLDHNEITKFQSGQFALLMDLTYLQIGNNPATEMEKAVFVNLPKLTGLGMEGLKIDTLPRNMFFNVPSLSTWNMNFGELDKIDSNVFMPFLMLTDLELAYNYFQTIKTGQFKGFTAQGVIHLSYNDISTIEAGAFPDLEFSELYLDNNDIKNLDDTWLQSIFDQQNSVSFDYNPLTCGCDLAWIFEDTAYLDQFLGSPTCSNGTLVKDLNQCYFAENC